MDIGSSGNIEKIAVTISVISFCFFIEWWGGREGGEGDLYTKTPDTGTNISDHGKKTMNM